MADTVNESGMIKSVFVEELANNGKIIRPAYKPIGEDKVYVPMEER